MDRGAWRDTVHRVAQSRTQLKQLSTAHKWAYHLAENTFFLMSGLLFYLAKKSQVTQNFHLNVNYYCKDLKENL